MTRFSQIGGVIAVLVISSSRLGGQITPAAVREMVRGGVTYEVQTTVSVAGAFPVGIMRPAGQTEIRIKGGTHYHEQVLQVARTGEAAKAIRHYLDLHLDRYSRGRQLRDDLRPQVRRIVMVRPGPAKVPFSPDGPLTADELDLLRGEIFTPALAGLLPGRAVAPGATWDATHAAITELTAIDPVQAGSIRCTARDLVDDRLRIDLAGTVSGPTEDGPARQTIDGSVSWSVSDRGIRAIDVRVRSDFLGPRGVVVGHVSAHYTLSRRRSEPDPELSETALAGLVLDATPETTALWFADAQVPYSFEYPRNWQVTRTVPSSQAVLHELTGGDLVITLHSPRVQTTASRLRDEIIAWLKSQKAVVEGTPALRSLRTDAGQHVDGITLETRFSSGPVTLLEYLLAPPAGQDRQTTLAATLPRAKAPALGADVARMVRTLRLRTGS